MGAIEDSITRYEQGLARLPELNGNDYEQNVWEVLLVRDAVAAALSKEDGATAASLARVAELDGRLNENASDIRNKVGANKLKSWREVKPPLAESWWWFLDERVARAEAEAEENKLKYNAAWVLLTFFFATVSLSLLAEISRRLFSGDGEWDSILGSFVQVPLNVIGALLGLLTVGTITDAGRGGVEGFLNRLGVLKKTGAVGRFAVALAFFCLILPIRLTLPFFAHYYNDRGARQVREGHFSEAADSYERAIKLKPDYAEAHYNLGDVYEHFHKCKESIPHYEAAVRFDNTFVHAQNNLARLYLKCGNEEQAASALAILEEQLAQPSDDDVRYSLLKNEGWAKSKLKRYDAAERDLRQALAIRDNGGSAHCLLASVLDDQNRSQEAADEWFQCLANSSDPDVEPEWAEEARQRYERSKVND